MNRLILPFLLMAAISGCDKIEGPYHEGSSKGVVYLSDDSLIINGDTLSFASDNSTPVKKILAEDYTGLLCGNCPYAGVKLNDTLKPAYGDRLVVMSVHAGFFASPCPGGLACPGNQPAGALTTDFRTTVGEEWDHFFGNSSAGNPNGLIDRMDWPATHIKTPSSWAAKIQERSALPARFGIRIINHYLPGTREIRCAVQVRNLAALTGNYKLQVVLTEDSVVDWQVWYPPHTPEFDDTYAHRYVLRESFNTEYGEQIISGNATAGELYLRGFSVALDPARVSAHCYVVAFVYNADTYEVLQVEQAPVMQ